jgi:hypothetical protein
VDGEIGDIPIPELLHSSEGKRGEGRGEGKGEGKEHLKAERKEQESGKAQESVEKSRKGSPSVLHCIPCEPRKKEDKVLEVIESRQIVPVQDMSGALSYNQKGATTSLPQSLLCYTLLL